MVFFQASMLDAMKSLRDELLPYKADVDKTSDPAQAIQVPGPSKTKPPTWISDHPWTWNLWSFISSKVYPKPHSECGVHLDPHSELHSEQASASEYLQATHKKHSDKRKHNQNPSENLSPL